MSVWIKCVSNIVCKIYQGSRVGSADFNVPLKGTRKLSWRTQVKSMNHSQKMFFSWRMSSSALRKRALEMSIVWTNRWSIMVICSSKTLATLIKPGKRGLWHCYPSEEAACTSERINVRWKYDTLRRRHWADHALENFKTLEAILYSLFQRSMRWRNAQYRALDFTGY